MSNIAIHCKCGEYCSAYVLQWIATIINVVRVGQRLESTEPLTVSTTIYDITQLLLFNLTHS